MTKKLFTEKQAGVSAFLGGPIPPGIILYKNYKALGKEKQAYTTLAITLIASVLIIYAALTVPENIMKQIPSFVISGVYSLIILLFFRKFMLNDLEKAYASGATKRSNWSVAGITALGLIVFASVLISFSLNMPYYEGEMKEVNGNELFYDNGIPQKDLEAVSELLVVTDFFGPEYGNIVQMKQSNNLYLITIVADEEYWVDQETIAFFGSIKELMESELNQSVLLRLESANLSGEIKYKNI